MRKITIKSIFFNLLKITLIILFVGTFSQIFGSINSLTWVGILIGIMMYWSLDIGIDKKQAPFIIALMYLLPGILNKIALINPILGFIINFATIFLITYIPSYKPEYKSYMPFVLCYIFNQSNPAFGHDFITRMISLFIGGLMVGLIYFFGHRKSEGNHNTIQHELKHINITSKRFILAIKMAIGVSIAMLIGSILGLKRTMWISISVMSLTQIDFKHTQQRFIARIVSTIIGSFAFALLFQVLIPEQYDVFVTLILNYIYTFIKDYKYQIIFITINSISSASVLFDTTTAIELRIALIILGCILGYVINRINLRKYLVILKRNSKRQSRSQTVNAN